MALSCRLELKQKQRLTTSLTLERKTMVQAHVLGIKLELLATITGDKYTPSGKCPNCYRELTPLEIIQGFRPDPYDYSTKCTGCGTRFEPLLICIPQTGIEIELPFFCSMQTLERLRGKEYLSPEQIAKNEPATYRSSIIHHGGLTGSFKQIGVDYPFKEELDWKIKIIPFLGNLPDTEIASCLNIPVHQIRNLRKKNNISRCTLSKMLENIDMEEAS